VEVDPGADAAYPRCHFGFVLRVPGDDERHAMPQALLDSAVAAVADEHRGSGQELLVREVVGQPDIRGQRSADGLAYGRLGAARGRDDGQHRVVGEGSDGRSDELAEIVVVESSLSDVDDRKVAEVVPPLRKEPDPWSRRQRSDEANARGHFSAGVLELRRSQVKGQVELASVVEEVQPSRRHAVARQRRVELALHNLKRAVPQQPVDLPVAHPTPQRVPGLERRPEGSAVDADEGERGD
jgi:hypothetical protein